MKALMTLTGASETPDLESPKVNENNMVENNMFILENIALRYLI